MKCFLRLVATMVGIAAAIMIPVVGGTLIAERIDARFGEEAAKMFIAAWGCLSIFVWILLANFDGEFQKLTFVQIRNSMRKSKCPGRKGGADGA